LTIFIVKQLFCKIPESMLWRSGQAVAQIVKSNLGESGLGEHRAVNQIAPCKTNRTEGISKGPDSGLTPAIRRRILAGMLAVRKRSRRGRATSQGPERTRELLLQAAFQEIYRSGYRGADLDAILAAAGVTKGALYYHFDNKEALGYAVVDEVIAINLYRKWVQPLRNAEDPIEVLVRIIQSESLKREDVQRGCPLLNLSQEMSGLDEGFRRRTGKVYEKWHGAMAQALREGQKRGIVRSDINADETATFLIAAWEGYVVLGKNSQDPRMMKSGQKRMTVQIKLLRPPRRRTRLARRR